MDCWLRHSGVLDSIIAVRVLLLVVLPGPVGLLRRAGPLLPPAVRQLGVPGMEGPLLPNVSLLMVSCARPW
jgi:hypothetical protein